MDKRFVPNVRAIMARELWSYFGSPIAYVFIVIFLLLCGFFTFNISKFYEAGQADLRPFFEWHPWIFLFMVSAVAMRLWADERKSGTMELMLTLPITLTQAILGKFLAAWMFMGIALVLTFPLVITAMYLGDPDLGAVFTAYVGSMLLAGAYLSIGTMTSAMTRNQVISFVLSVVIGLFFVMAGWPPVIDALAGKLPRLVIELVSGFSIMTHYMGMQKGVLDLRDFIYYFSLMSFMLVLTGVILTGRRSS